MELKRQKRFYGIKSIRTKLILIMIGMLGFTLAAIWFMNRVFLPSYYQHSKVSMLEECYEEANSIVNKDKDYSSGESTGLSDDSTLNLEIMSANNTSSVYIFRLNNFFGKVYYQYDYPSEKVITEFQRQNIIDKTKDYVVGIEDSQSYYVRDKKRNLIDIKNEYCVYKVLDERIGSYYIELFGKLDSGAFVYVSTNYQSMAENIGIFNSFLLYVGVGVIIFGVILMVFIGNNFTKPIRKLTEIAQKMADFNFEVRYPVKEHDEIGVLGSSINTLSENLEEKISELKTANNELQKDIEKKIQIDEMRKEFLSNVSHELKTPIALIQGYAEGLYDNINDDSESREFYCEVIMDEADKMNKMVKKLLTLNQIEFGNNQVNFEHFDIVQVVRTVINSATLLAKQKEAQIEIDDYPQIYVWADEYMIEEVVTNYVSNAINHVDGEKKIKVSLKKTDKVVRVSVFNTGKCIPEEELDKIWIKFYKVDKARTREYGGSGIGLSIVKAIMESMNQKCGVLNHEDGVEFWFELDIEN